MGIRWKELIIWWQLIVADWRTYASENQPIIITHLPPWCYLNECWYIVKGLNGIAM